jgi:radical SAM-linked protein
MKFLGHLDVTRALLRAFRRARLPLAYSQGFNPKPRVQFGPALAVGIESVAEMLELELTAPIEAATTLEAINGSLPAGLHGIALQPRAEGAPASPSRSARRGTSSRCPRAWMRRELPPSSPSAVP